MKNESNRKYTGILGRNSFYEAKQNISLIDQLKH